MPLFSSIITHLLAPHSFLVGLVCFLCLLLDTQHNTTLQHNITRYCNQTCTTTWIHQTWPKMLVLPTGHYSMLLSLQSLSPMWSTTKSVMAGDRWYRRATVCVPTHTTRWRNMSAGAALFTDQLPVSPDTKLRGIWGVAHNYWRLRVSLVEIYVWHNVWQIYSTIVLVGIRNRHR